MNQDEELTILTYPQDPFAHNRCDVGANRMGVRSPSTITSPQNRQ
jgi:hypothetical protein